MVPANGDSRPPAFARRPTTVGAESARPAGLPRSRRVTARCRGKRGRVPPGEARQDASAELVGAARPQVLPLPRAGRGAAGRDLGASHLGSSAADPGLDTAGAEPREVDSPGSDEPGGLLSPVGRQASVAEPSARGYGLPGRAAVPCSGTIDRRRGTGIAGSISGATGLAHNPGRHQAQEAERQVRRARRDAHRGRLRSHPLKRQPSHVLQARVSGSGQPQRTAGTGPRRACHDGVGSRRGVRR